MTLSLDHDSLLLDATIPQRYYLIQWSEKPGLSHAMVVRRLAASLLDMEKRFRRIMGCGQLWMLDAKLKELAEDDTVDAKSQVA
jgi:hypothetical protein